MKGIMRRRRMGWNLFLEAFVNKSVLLSGHERRHL
jgi:hypothetical protein